MLILLTGKITYRKFGYIKQILFYDRLRIFCRFKKNSCIFKFLGYNKTKVKDSQIKTGIRRDDLWSIEIIIKF